MADIALDFRIYHKRRRVAELQVSADPDNPGALAKILKGWLEGDGWDKGRFGEFHAEVRKHGRGKVETTVRV